MKNNYETQYFKIYLVYLAAMSPSIPEGFFGSGF